MTNESIIDDEEELFLVQQLLDARHRLEQHKKAMQSLRGEQNGLEARVNEAETALLDYLTANGIKQSSCGPYTMTLLSAEAVEIPDLDAVPDEFCRVKKEPNKSLIRELRPAGNWYNINSNPSIRIVRNLDSSTT